MAQFRLSRPRLSRDEPIEDWPYLDREVLLPSRSRRVCFTCHWFRHHPGANCIPLLTCQLHQGLIAHGEHLTRRCQGWTEDLVRQRGWAPEGATSISVTSARGMGTNATDHYKYVETTYTNPLSISTHGLAIQCLGRTTEHGCLAVAAYRIDGYGFGEILKDIPMIECMSGLPEGTLGFSFQGKITADDYDHVLTPALDAALEQHDRLKLLAQLGPSFEGYDLGAAWADGREALRHWDGFERLALVSDVAWVRTAVAAFSLVMPCPVRVFANADLEDARRWLSESLGTIHLERHDDVIQVQLIGTLEASVYERAEANIAAEIHGLDGVRLLLDLRQFDGWAGLGALGRHLAVIRDYRRTIQRVGVVGNKAWQALAEKLVGRFVDAETRFFENADYALAETWIRR